MFKCLSAVCCDIRVHLDNCSVTHSCFSLNQILSFLFRMWLMLIYKLFFNVNHNLCFMDKKRYSFVLVYLWWVAVNLLPHKTAWCYSSDHNIITLGSFFNLLFFDYYCDNNHDKHETGNLEFGDTDSSSLL